MGEYARSAALLAEYNYSARCWFYTTVKSEWLLIHGLSTAANTPACVSELSVAHIRQKKTAVHQEAVCDHTCCVTVTVTMPMHATRTYYGNGRAALQSSSQEVLIGQDQLSIDVLGACIQHVFCHPTCFPALWKFIILSPAPLIQLEVLLFCPYGTPAGVATCPAGVANATCVVVYWPCLLLALRLNHIQELLLLVCRYTSLLLHSSTNGQQVLYALTPCTCSSVHRVTI